MNPKLSQVEDYYISRRGVYLKSQYKNMLWANSITNPTFSFCYLDGLFRWSIIVGRLVFLHLIRRQSTILIRICIIGYMAGLLGLKKLELLAWARIPGTEWDGLLPCRGGRWTCTHTPGVIDKWLWRKATEISSYLLVLAVKTDGQY